MQLHRRVCSLHPEQGSGPSPRNDWNQGYWEAGNCLEEVPGGAGMLQDTNWGHTALRASYKHRGAVGAEFPRVLGR